MSEYIKLSDRTEDRLSGYMETGRKRIFDTDKLQSFVKENGWSVQYTNEVAQQLLRRIEESPESIFEIY